MITSSTERLLDGSTEEELQRSTTHDARSPTPILGFIHERE